jgi:hypothetical protein
LLPDKLRSIFRRENGAAPPPGGSPRYSSPPAGVSARKITKKDGSTVRQSRGIEQFFFDIRGAVGLSVLDLAGANQDNIDFLIDLGHKVYTQDLVSSIDEAFGRDLAEQVNPGRIEYFLKQNFDYPQDTFDGVMLWDSLQFMSPVLLAATVDRLYEVMRPKSYLLAFFSASERVVEVPSYAFRIVDNKTIHLTERGMRPTGQVFNNRNLEKIFSRFSSVKFFLTRENLREIIVRR